MYATGGVSIVLAQTFFAETGKIFLYHAAQPITQHYARHIQNHIVHIAVPSQEKLTALSAQGKAESEAKGFLRSESPEQQPGKETKGKKSAHISKELDDGIGEHSGTKGAKIIGYHPEGNEIHVVIPILPAVVDYQIAPKSVGCFKMISRPQNHSCQTKQAQDQSMEHPFPQGRGVEPLSIQRPVAVGEKAAKNQRRRNANAEKVG
jgi:hypothetical protein